MQYKHLTRIQLSSLTDTNMKLFECCQSVGLLQKEIKCKCCKQLMKLECTSHTSDGLGYRCYSRKCGKPTRSIRTGTFFARSALPLKTLIFLIYEWSRDNPIKEVCHEYELSKTTVIDWFRFLRDVCYEGLQTISPLDKIGGEGKTIEIDETVVVRRKYNRGRVVNTIWLVGGIMRGKNSGRFWRW